MCGGSDVMTAGEGVRSGREILCRDGEREREGMYSKTPIRLAAAFSRRMEILFGETPQVSKSRNLGGT